MKTAGALALIVTLIVLCVLQQIWIVQLRQGAGTPASRTVPPAAPTWDIHSLAQSLDPPAGATDTGRDASSRLGGVGHGKGAFEGCLWIDISKARLDGETAPERRVAAVAEHYARRISRVIPDATIEAAIDQAGMVESGNLHSTYVIRHPSGHVVVCAGYKSLPGVPAQVTDVVKVHVVAVKAPR
jgi:hypothetical protein